MRPVLTAVAATALLLAACSTAPVRLPGSIAHPRTGAIPSTRRAAEITGPVRSMASAIVGQAYDLPWEQSVSGFVPGRGLLVSAWPQVDAQGISTSPGRLLLLDPTTGRAHNLMGPAAPGLEPIMVTSDREWVFWAEIGDLGGGPQPYYLYNLKTGTRRRFSDALTASDPYGALSGAALEGDDLFVTGAMQSGACTVSEVLRVDLLHGGTTPLVVARDCAATASRHIATLPSRARSGLPLRLLGTTVARLAVTGHRLLFVAMSNRDPAEPSHPSLLVQLDLATGAARAVARSPSTISAVAADADVTAFVAGTDGSTLVGDEALFVLYHGKLRLVEGTQGSAPMVSGHLVTCEEGSGDVYDARDGTIYRPLGPSSMTLAGPWVSWSAPQGDRVARIEPSLLR